MRPAATQAPAPDLRRRRSSQLLPYTSGTTGHPKGCMLSHAFEPHAQRDGGQVLWNGLVPESVNLAVVPMFHITGVVGVMHAAIHAGATLGAHAALGPRRGGAPALGAAKRDALGQHPDHGDRPHGELPLRERLRSLAPQPTSAAAARPCRKAVAQRLLEKTRTALKYQEGLRPHGDSRALAQQSARRRPSQQCLGLPVHRVSTRASSTPQTLQPNCRRNRTARSWCAGPRSSRATGASPRPRAAAFVEIEGLRFFRTGDIGRVDADGYFFITDRLKRMINASAASRSGPPRSRR
jgi:fatty-acyl-CoA synthase